MLSRQRGLFALGEEAGLPQVPAINIAMLINDRTINDAGRRLAEHIRFALADDPSLTNSR